MAKEKTCLVIGDINIDFNVKTSYYPPEGGETHAEESVFRLGGSGCTTALILQKLGIECALAANLGNDLFAQFALEQIRSGGLDSSLVHLNPLFPTGFFMILITGAAQRTMFGNRGANAVPLPLARVQTSVDSAQHIHFSGYNLLGADQAAAMLETMRYGAKNGKTISLDPGTHTCKAVPERVQEALTFVDYFLPNNTEAEILTGKENEDAQITSLLEFGCKAVVLKKGASGSRYVSETADIAAAAFSLESSQTQDTTGAGDSFNAGFLSGIFAGKPIADCLKMGNAAGYLMITAPGGPLDFLERTNLSQEIRSIIN